MRPGSIDEFNVAGLEVRIEHDDGPHDYPFEDDDGIEFITFERNSTLSTRHSFDEPEEALEFAKAAGLETFPLFKYEHGNVCYRSTPFACPWDSGQAGFVFIKREEVGDVEECLKGACETLTDWCNGSIYGYVVEDPDGNHLDSCWGFYGIDYCKHEATGAATDAARAYFDQLWTAQAAELEASRPDMYQGS